MTSPTANGATLPTLDQIQGTPQVLYDYPGLQRRVTLCAASASARGVTLAYSIKTNPVPTILQYMCDAGLSAEAISGAEAQVALKAGFPSERVVLGGVAKFWPTGSIPKRLFALLDDSVEGFATSVDAGGQHKYHCLRLRFPNESSRIGTDISDTGQRHHAIRSLLKAQGSGAAVGLALHKHNVINSAARYWLTSIQELLKKLDNAHPGILSVIECLDLGGGYDSPCLDSILSGTIGDALMTYVSETLPQCQALVLEPGKSLVQAYGMVVASVIARVSNCEVSVDASMAELPWPMPDRPTYLWRDGDWRPMPPGSGIVTGRTTAETDVLANSVDVSSLRKGDLVLFGEAGAYDASMRNGFGTGTAHMV